MHTKTFKMNPIRINLSDKWKHVVPWRKGYVTKTLCGENMKIYIYDNSVLEELRYSDQRNTKVVQSDWFRSNNEFSALGRGKKMVNLFYLWGSAWFLDTNLERNSPHPVALCPSISISRICCTYPNSMIFISPFICWCVEIGGTHMCLPMKAQVEAISWCQTVSFSGFPALVFEFPGMARLAD